MAERNQFAPRAWRPEFRRSARRSGHRPSARPFSSARGWSPGGKPACPRPGRDGVGRVLRRRSPCARRPPGRDGKTVWHRSRTYHSRCRQKIHFRARRQRSLVWRHANQSVGRRQAGQVAGTGPGQGAQTRRAGRSIPGARARVFRADTARRPVWRPAGRAESAARSRQPAAPAPAPPRNENRRNGKADCPAGQRPTRAPFDAEDERLARDAR